MNWGLKSGITVLLGLLSRGLTVTKGLLRYSWQSGDSSQPRGGELWLGGLQLGTSGEMEMKRCP